MRTGSGLPLWIFVLIFKFILQLQFIVESFEQFVVTIFKFILQFI